MSTKYLLTTINGFKYLLALLFLFTPITTYANPQGGQVAAGNANISTASPQTLQINQSSEKAVINWQSFNIGQGESVHFQQPNSSSITLNRINPQSGASTIYGSIKANGQVWLVNPSGIWFGPTAHVDVAGLIATTASISNADFLSGHYRFIQDPEWNGAIVNEGYIKAAQAGLIALAGPGVVNNGYIEATLGTVVLASGSAFTVNFSGNDLISFTVDRDVIKPARDKDGHLLADAINNSGVILADGGKISMTVHTASDVLDHTINMRGVVQANSVGMKNGEIILMSSNGNIRVSGKLLAAGKSKNEKGGSIHVLSNTIVLSDASIDASGEAGGGEILIGGNAHGSGPEPNANYTFMNSGTVINANAITQGNGGKVVVWSNLGTLFYGTILARGGLNGGNGGWVETSGKAYLEAIGAVDASAAQGAAGSWLLDPANVTISAALTANGSFSGGNPNTFTTTANDAIANVSAIQTSLNGGTSVTILTSPNGSQNGDITLSSAISKTAGGAATLTLTANTATGGVINLNQPISATTGALTVTLNGANIYLGANITSNGGSINFNNPVSLTAPITLSSNAGAVTFSSTVDGANSLTVNSTGATTFSGVVGSINALSSLTTNTGGTTVLNTSSITATGDITFNDAVTLATTDKTITSTGGQIKFTTTVNGGFGLTLSGNTAVIFNGVVGGTSALANIDVTGPLSITVTSVTTTGVQRYHSDVTLGANLTLTTTDNAVTLASTIDRDATARNLTITTGAGDIELDGNVGAGVNGALGVVTLNSTGTTTLGGTFASSRLTTNAGGTTAINGGSVTTSIAAGQVYNDAVTLNADATLNASAGAINFASTIDSFDNTARGLTLNTTGTTTFSGIIGNTNALSFLTTNAGGTTSMGTTAITTIGDQTFNDAVSLTVAGKTLTSTSGAIIFNNTVNGARTLSLSTLNGVTFNSTVGNGATLSSLDITGPAMLNTTGITTSGTQAYHGPITLDSNITLSTAANNVTIDSTIDRVASADTLTISVGAGSITLSGDIGTGVNGPLGAITLTSSGTTTISGSVKAASISTNANGTTVLNTNQIETSGDITFNDPVTLATLLLPTTKTFTSTAGTITFNNTLNGDFVLDLSGNVGVVFNGVVGGVTPLASLDITGSMNISSTGVTTLGMQEYHNPITLTSNTTLTTTDSSLLIDSTLGRDGTARTLTINTGAGDITLSDDVGVGGALGATNLNSTGQTTINGTFASARLTTDAGGFMAINGGSVTTTNVGGQVYNDAVTLGADTLLAANAGAITFASTIDSFDSTARSLTLNTTGTTTIGDVVGGTNSLSSLTTNSGGTTVIDSSAITTNGDQNYGDNVTLATAAKILTSSIGSITFTGTVNGAEDLTLLANAGVTFTSNVGTGTALNNLDVTGNTLIDTARITTTGIQDYHSSVTINANVILNANTADITFDSTLDSQDATARDLTLNSSSITTFNGVVGGINPLGALTTNAAGSTVINGGSIITAGAQAYNDAVSLGSATILTVTAANSNILLPNTANNITTNLTFAAAGSGSVRDITLVNDAADALTPTFPASFRNLIITYNNASIVFPTLTLTGTLTATANGSITQNNGTTLTVAGLPTFDVTAANSDVLLGNANDMNGGIAPIFTSRGAGSLRDVTFRNTAANAVFPSFPTGVSNLDLLYDNSGMIIASSLSLNSFTAIAGGIFTINDGVTLATSDALTITATDLNLNTSGALTSTGNTITFTAATPGGSIGLGNTSGTVSISGAELQRFTALNLNLIAANNGQILVDGITAAESGNIANTITLNATNGSLANIVFVNATSTFKSLLLTASDGITINTTMNGITDLTLEGGAGAINLNAEVGTTSPLTSIYIASANGFTSQGLINTQTFIMAQNTDTTNFLGAGLLTTGNTSITSNRLLGTTNVASLTINLTTGNFYGTVHGRYGVPAIKLITVLSVPRPGVIFFDGYDIYQVQHPQPATANIVFPTNYTNQYPELAMAESAQLLKNQLDWPENKIKKKKNNDCVVVAPSIELCGQWH